jgi:starch synthase/alpha-amylase
MEMDSHITRILVVTPEVAYLPRQIGAGSQCMSAKAGGLADVSAALICELQRRGIDVHVALPNYRGIFDECHAQTRRQEKSPLRRVLPQDRLHLAEDHAFVGRRHIYSGEGPDNVRLALAFQREVINNIIPRVVPELIHCNDWMTGLIPAAAHPLAIPTLFSVHNIHTMEIELAELEERGIDPASFWQHLYYREMPGDYEQTLRGNPLDPLVSGVFAANAVSVVSPSFLAEIIADVHDLVPAPLRLVLRDKWKSGMGRGIVNAPAPAFNPATDPHLAARYGAEDCLAAKKVNKLALQKALELEPDPEAPILFWPSRLDPRQKGCDLLAQILYRVISTYWESGLQLAFVADGDYRRVFSDIRRLHDFERRIALHPFDPALEHLGYGGADFVLMPSRYEPCGLPQMIGAIYGALPIAHAVGGLRDTVQHLDVARNRGNGFLFENHDSGGLLWAIGEAMHFYRRQETVRSAQIQRIMRESTRCFNIEVMADQYLALYAKLLGRPLATPSASVPTGGSAPRPGCRRDKPDLAAVP